MVKMIDLVSYLMINYKVDEEVDLQKLKDNEKLIIQTSKELDSMCDLMGCAVIEK